MPPVPAWRARAGPVVAVGSAGASESRQLPPDIAPWRNSVNTAASAAVRGRVLHRRLVLAQAESPPAPVAAKESRCAARHWIQEDPQRRQATLSSASRPGGTFRHGHGPQRHQKLTPKDLRAQAHALRSQAAVLEMESTATERLTKASAAVKVALENQRLARQQVERAQDAAIPATSAHRSGIQGDEDAPRGRQDDARHGAMVRKPKIHSRRRGSAMRPSRACKPSSSARLLAAGRPRTARR